VTSGGSGDHAYVQVGDVVRVRLPYSEVCIHMRVAGKPMNVQVVGDGDSAVAQLLNDDGSRFSFPVLLGEAGIHTDGTGRHYVPNRMLVLAEDGIGGL
jgi:hypothetical protein